MSIDLSHSALFKGLSHADITSALACLEVKACRLSKKEYLNSCEPHHIGILLSGSLYMSSEDEKGNRHIINIVKPGDIFGEQSLYQEPMNEKTYEQESYSLYAAEHSEALLISTKSILEPTNICKLRSKIIENLFSLLIAHNQGLHSKLQIVSLRTLRQRIMHYLLVQAQQMKHLTFMIPLSRTELADYLSVDRSALSRELANMKNDKLIDYNKNSFTILNKHTELKNL